MYIKISCFVFFLCSFLNSFANTVIPFEKLKCNEKKCIGSVVDENYKDSLLKLYKEKENLFIKLEKQNNGYIKDKYHLEYNHILETADRVVDKEFLYDNEWDLERTIVPYRFKSEIVWDYVPFGDMEWVWALNRHRYWVDLGKAYLLTGNEIYVKTFIDQVIHWIDNNPFNTKTRNTSWRVLEVGFRMENWIKAFELMKSSPNITGEFFYKFISSLHDQAAYLNSLDGVSTKTNWSVIAFGGLFYASNFLSDFKPVSSWTDKSLKILDNSICNQITNEGVQVEQSGLYQSEILRIYLNVIMLARRAGVDFPQNIEMKTKKMVEANIHWQKPNYRQPMIGDTDDMDTRYLQTFASLLYRDPIFKSRANVNMDLENLMVWGIDSIKEYDRLGTILPSYTSVFHKETGDLYSRSSWHDDAFYSRFHMKRLGTNHSHDDLLHFSLFAYGRDYLVDCGRYTYVDNKWRRYFKVNSAHNTLGVDNMDNSVYNNAWSNASEAQSDSFYVKISDKIDYAEANNNAYKRLDDPVNLIRRVVYIKPDVWILIDFYDGKEEHLYSQYFNFRDEKVKISSGKIFTTYDDNNLCVEPLDDVDISLSSSWYSSHYNYKERSVRAELSKLKSGFSSFVTLLYFPENNNIGMKRLPVYDLQNHLLTERDAVAVEVIINDMSYIIVINNMYSLNKYVKVEGHNVSSEAVILNRDGKVNVLK